MASSESVHPLRITKTTPMSSPTKKVAAFPRPLSEISPSEKRRNSPSWNQTTKKMGLSTDSSPFQSSPLDGTTSPRLFWQNRSGFNTENMYGGRSGSPSPTRRSSIERLQKASRVKNSSILALEQKNEYDPTVLPRVERPLAKVQSNAFGGFSTTGMRSGGMGHRGHQRSQSKTDIPLYSPTKVSMSAPVLSTDSDKEESVDPEPESEAPSTVTRNTMPLSPSKEQASPIKSSLSSRFRNSYTEHGENSFEESFDDQDLPSAKSLHRHGKSVTFDAAPPQVNEYEMATPDLSSVGSNSREGSFESEEDEDDYDEYHYSNGDGSTQDDSFDASLEDTDKTPVVGPEDWRQESPESRRNDMFERSPMPETLPSVAMGHEEMKNAAGSSGEHRPLPPLPGFMQSPRAQSNSSTGLSATAERMLGGSPRGLPSPPPASTTKSEIQNIGTGKMTLEERLRLMMLSDDNNKSAAETQRERRMRRAGPGNRDRANSQTTPEPEASFHEAASHLDEEDDIVGDLSGLEEYQLPPRISRESILRRANGGVATSHEQETDYIFSSPPPSSSPERRLPLDPDVPIPSTEHDDDSIVKEDDKEVDAYNIPGMYVTDGDDDDSHYSDCVNEEQTNGLKPAEDDGDLITTPRAGTPVKDVGSSHTIEASDIHMPAFESLPNGGRISLDALHVSEPVKEAPVADAPKMADAHAYLQRPFTPELQTEPKPLSKPEYDGTGWGDDEEFEEPGTPDSVIHHPVQEEEIDIYEDARAEDDEPVQETPEVAEHVATIKAPGAKLKTRPSATPSDIEAMREARRVVSGEMPLVPPIPDRHRDRLSRNFDGENGEKTTIGETLERQASLKNRSLTLDLDLGLSLDQDFERVIEAQKVALQRFPSRQHKTASAFPTPSIPTRQASQKAMEDDKCSGHPRYNSHDNTENTNMIDKANTNITSRKQRGYLMRQNTKFVAASDKDGEDLRGARSAGNSPVKKEIRPQSWTVEPWNGQIRRKSVRKQAPRIGPVPPLPGQESNAAALNTLQEDDAAAEVTTEEGAERGRLFVKVMGVKDLELPMPRNERTWFSLTLDNGVHCVTTAWLELARNAPIGQEFELLVPNDLEFQLTLNVKIEKPAPTVVKKVIHQSSSPVKVARPKQSTFSRVFASPKKRKEMEQRFKEEEERAVREHEQREAQAAAAAAAKQVKKQPTGYDLLSPLVAEDGSFARAYVCLKEHESRCYGRPGIVDIACFNEWATEEASFASSVKSKRGDMAVVRKAPYKIGKLELQLLFVPRPKGVGNDDMPKSMNSCIREMKAAEERLSRNWEGHLSQQGGDCPYWRRRYFKLVGTKLTAYHEATRQPRATINLANARRLIDDRRALTEKETTGKNGKRRRSAFAEEEEGYMFVEEGFRIRFNNGEVIDFYADTAADKEGWMKVLMDVIARDNGSGDDDSASTRNKTKWCELVMKREDAMRKRAEGRRVHSRTKSMYT